MKLFKAEDEGCQIWEENLESFTVFQALTTQWRVSDMGHFFGLIYPAVESVLNLMITSKKRKSELFYDIRVMESAALEILNRERK